MTTQHGWGPSAGPVPALQWGQCKNVRTAFLTWHPPATTDWSGTHSGAQAGPKLIIFLPQSLMCWDYRCEPTCRLAQFSLLLLRIFHFPLPTASVSGSVGVTQHRKRCAGLLCETAQVRKESHSSFHLGCLHLKKTIFFFISFSNRDTDIGKMFSVHCMTHNTKLESFYFH